MNGIARRSDGEALPCPAEREWFDLSLALSPAEAARVEAGFVPRGSDDRWFLFVEEDTLYCHRSWTGECVFGATVERHGGFAAITRCWVSRDHATYASGGIESDRQLLVDLVRSHLLDG